MTALFRVFMIGLICHIGEDSDTAGTSKTCAVIINEPAHHAAPRICIKGGDLYPEGGDVNYRLQRGDQITFSLSGSKATTDALFQNAIPSLTHITNGGQLHKKIKTCDQHDDALGYIVYPSGKLTIARTYEHTWKYVLLGNSIDKFPHCIGSISEFNATTTHPSVIVTITNTEDSNRRASYEVKAAGAVCIMNDSTHRTSGQHHLNHHRGLTNAPLVARVVRTNNPCKLPEVPILPDCAFPPDPQTLQDPDLDDPECSNSQWP